MSESITIQTRIHFANEAKGRKRIQEGPPPEQVPQGRIPRVSKLLALAHRFDGLIRDGTVKDYAALARLGHVTRARITQIMNLLMLAPDVQESILFLPRTVRGRDPIRIQHLQPIALTPDWGEQRRRWRKLAGEATR